MTTTLVLLPGMDGSGLLSGPLVEELAGESVLSVRFPVDDPSGFNRLTDFVRTQLPREGQFVLFAESFSGPIAIRLAAERPRGLIGLILCASFAACPAQRLRVLKPLLPFLPIGPMARGLGPRVLAGRFRTSGTTRLLRDAIGRLSAKVLRSRVEAVIEADETATLAEVRVPALFIRASEDALISNAAVERMLRSCPSGRVIDVLGPHALTLCAPREVADVIRGFVESAELKQ